jgi:hypothetical protein
MDIKKAVEILKTVTGQVKLTKSDHDIVLSAIDFLQKASICVKCQKDRGDKGGKKGG